MILKILTRKKYLYTEKGERGWASCGNEINLMIELR